MRLYQDSYKHLCLWCGATEDDCLDAPLESTALRCCPDCDHGKPVVVVPWCAEHDHEWVNVTDGCWANRGHPTPCRLEEPARHLRIDGNAVNP